VQTHAQHSLSQRAIDVDTVSDALDFGRKIEQDGATVHLVGRRQLPRGLVRDEADGVEGTAVVLAASVASSPCTVRPAFRASFVGVAASRAAGASFTAGTTDLRRIARRRRGRSTREEATKRPRSTASMFNRRRQEKS
jgi:hypothetical protein